MYTTQNVIVPMRTSLRSRLGRATSINHFTINGSTSVSPLPTTMQTRLARSKENKGLTCRPSQRTSEDRDNPRHHMMLGYLPLSRSYSTKLFCSSSFRQSFPLTELPRCRDSQPVSH